LSGSLFFQTNIIIGGKNLINRKLLTLRLILHLLNILNVFVTNIIIGIIEASFNEFGVASEHLSGLRGVAEGTRSCRRVGAVHEAILILAVIKGWLIADRNAHILLIAH